MKSLRIFLLLFFVSMCQKKRDNRTGRAEVVPGNKKKINIRQNAIVFNSRYIYCAIQLFHCVRGLAVLTFSTYIINWEIINSIFPITSINNETDRRTTNTQNK